jgi:hypothetical protein
MAVAGPSEGRWVLVENGGKLYWYSSTESPSFLEAIPRPGMPGFYLPFRESYPSGFIKDFIYGSRVILSGSQLDTCIYPTDYPRAAPAWVICAHCGGRYDQNQSGHCPGCGSRLIETQRESPGSCRVELAKDPETERIEEATTDWLVAEKYEATKRRKQRQESMIVYGFCTIVLLVFLAWKLIDPARFEPEDLIVLIPMQCVCLFAFLIAAFTKD